MAPAPDRLRPPRAWEALLLLLVQHRASTDTRGVHTITTVGGDDTDSLRLIYGLCIPYSHDTTHPPRMNCDASGAEPDKEAPVKSNPGCSLWKRSSSILLRSASSERASVESCPTSRHVHGLACARTFPCESETTAQQGAKPAPSRLLHLLQLDVNHAVLWCDGWAAVSGRRTGDRERTAHQVSRSTLTRPPCGTARPAARRPRVSSTRRPQKQRGRAFTYGGFPARPSTSCRGENSQATSRARTPGGVGTST